MALAFFLIQNNFMSCTIIQAPNARPFLKKHFQNFQYKIKNICTHGVQIFSASEAEIKSLHCCS